MTTVHGMFKKRATANLRAIYGRLVGWTKPAARPPVRGAIADVAMTKAALVAENALLRQQLIVFQRQVARPVFTPRDRVLLVLLARLVRGWRAALLVVQPATVLRWHRQGYRLVWRMKSATAAKRPQVPEETVVLIKRMASSLSERSGRSVSWVVID